MNPIFFTTPGSGIDRQKLLKYLELPSTATIGQINERITFWFLLAEADKAPGMKTLAALPSQFSRMQGSVNVDKICLLLGLPVTSSDEEINNHIEAVQWLMETQIIPDVANASAKATQLLYQRLKSEYEALR